MPITLSSRFARRAALAGAAATLSIALAACSASFDAPTLQPYQAAEGTNAESGGLKVRNMLVLADAEGKGELHSVIVNDSDSDDTLVKIEQAPAGAKDGQAGSDQPEPGSVTFSGLTSPVQLKSHSAVLLPGGGTITAGQTTPGATPSATPSPGDTPSATPGTPSETPSTGQQTPGTEQPGPAITVTGAKPGQMLNVTISFGTAAPITTYVPVLTNDHYSASPSAAE